VAWRLWSQFLGTKGRAVFTKKFLSTLFRGDMGSVSQLRTYGFSGLLEEMKASEVLAGKNELRRVVIGCLS
jgi:hypothetical protein